MQVAQYHNHQQIDSCALEIADYITDHTHWEKPILPGDGSCSDLQFEPEQFDHGGNFWKCIEQNTGKI